MNNSTNIITIEKNIPIPAIRAQASRTKYKFLKTMEVGDSFVINGNTPDFRPIGVQAYVYKMNRTVCHGRKYSVRTLSGKGTRPTSIRVWRIK